MSLSDCRNCDGDTALFTLYRACASMAVLAARNKARRIEAAVGRLPASWVATLIEIVLVLGLARVPSDFVEGGARLHRHQCAPPARMISRAARRRSHKRGIRRRTPGSPSADLYKIPIKARAGSISNPYAAVGRYAPQEFSPAHGGSSRHARTYRAGADDLP